MIDSTLEDGHVTYGEIALEGAESSVFLLSTSICHPALANDNLSGIVLLAGLARVLGSQTLRYSYRFVWSPGTIGPLCWLHTNRGSRPRITHGLAVSCVGDPGPLTLQAQPPRGCGDRPLPRRPSWGTSPGRGSRDWSPYGGDERQFCSPGFDLPVGAFSRTPADAFPEYHSSADDLELVRPEALGDSLHAALRVIDAIERNDVLVNASPYGEPQLGRRGLYRSIGGGSSEEEAILWVLSLSDGSASLIDISLRSALPFEAIRAAADALLAVDLVRPGPRPAVS